MVVFAKNQIRKFSNGRIVVVVGPRTGHIILCVCVCCCYMRRCCCCHELAIEHIGNHWMVGMVGIRWNRKHRAGIPNHHTFVRDVILLLRPPTVIYFSISIKSAPAAPPTIANYTIFATSSPPSSCLSFSPFMFPAPESHHPTLPPVYSFIRNGFYN